MKVIFRDLALADLEQIATYLQERSPAGARNVLQAIHDAIRDVAFNPEGGRRTADPAVRLKVVNRYGYKIYYVLAVEGVEILHVRHGARRPWTVEKFD